MIAIIDNYDSFTYNVRDAIASRTRSEVRVFRNDAIDADGLARLSPEAVVISPGPGDPDGAGISLDAIRAFAGKVPILGVCLGHQAIARAFGGKVVRARRVVHGKAEAINHDGRGLFRGVPKGAAFARYHSLAVEEKSLPDCLEVTARSADGEIMGLRHREFDIEGVQFHPESVASPEGFRLVENFLDYRREGLDRKALLTSLMAGRPMPEATAALFFSEVAEGRLSDAYIASVLSCVGTRAPDPGEIAGCASELRRRMTRVRHSGEAVDTCGTGGDGASTFNVSSLAAIVAASAGAVVAKHGNRAVSSACGCADYYAALGIPLDASAELSEDMLEHEGFAYLHAPNHHPAMRRAAGARAEMGVRTLFNLLGPLANPAGAKYQLIGVYSPSLVLPVARAAVALGARRVLVCHSRDGLDEFSVSAPTDAVLADDRGNESSFAFDPVEAGIGPFPSGSLKGGTAAENAAATPGILAGDGPVSRAVALNAGAALFAGGRTASIAEGYAVAREAMLSGRAAGKLEEILNAYRKRRGCP